MARSCRGRQKILLLIFIETIRAYLSFNRVIMNLKGCSRLQSNIAGGRYRIRLLQIQPAISDTEHVLSQFGPLSITVTF